MAPVGRIARDIEECFIHVWNVTPKSELNNPTVDPVCLAVIARTIEPGNGAQDSALHSGRTLGNIVFEESKDAIANATVVYELREVDLQSAR